MKKMASSELTRLSSILKPDAEKIVSDIGFNLHDLVFVVENNINYLRVTISHLDRKVSLDDCEKISRRIDKFLDSRNLIPFPYTLEVQSKGVKTEVENVSEYSFTLSKLGLVVKS